MIPGDPGPEPHSSGGLSKVATVREATVISEEIAAGVKLATKIQWGAIGAVVVAFGLLLNHVLTKMDLVNTAQAETMAIAKSAGKASEINATRIEVVDAGTRAAIERLERKIDTNEEHAQKERDLQMAKLDAVLREVKKR